MKKSPASPKQRETFGGSEYGPVISLWLAQTQAGAKTRPCLSQSGGFLSDGRMFFIYSCIYSYGLHFPIALITPNKKSILVNDNYDDATKMTRSHIDKVVRACESAGKNLVYCDEPGIDHGRNVDAFIERLIWLQTDMTRRRRPILLEDEIFHYGAGTGWAGSYVRNSSDITHLKIVIAKLHAYLDCFRIRTKYRKVCREWLSGKDAPETIARRVIDEIIQGREVIKQNKKSAQKAKAVIKRKERRQYLKKKHEKYLESLDHVTQRVRLVRLINSQETENEDDQDIYSQPARLVTTRLRHQRLFN